MRAVAIAIVTLAAWAAPARADSFEDRARGAASIEPEDLVWALTARCDQPDDVHQRQCRQIRERWRQSLPEKLRLDADPSAFQLGAWDPARKSSAVRLAACVRCRGIVVDDKTWYVVGTGPARLEGDGVRASMLHDTARVFPDEAEATAWQKPLAGARVEMIVKLPRTPRIQIGGKDAIQLEVLAWRVVTPCDGGVVIASQPSGPALADKAACAATGAR
jgi:hypothetical protein